MIDHVSIGVTGLEAGAAFYDAVLEALGMRRLKEFPEAIGYGHDRPTFWIGASGESGFSPGPGLHVAFAAKTREAVDAFHATALSHGGRDAGAPGPRPWYGPDYYGAFVFDPTGTKVEAVCRADSLPVP